MAEAPDSQSRRPEPGDDANPIVLWDPAVVLHYIKRDDDYRFRFQRRAATGTPTITLSCYAEVLTVLARSVPEERLKRFEEELADNFDILNVDLVDAFYFAELHKLIAAEPPEQRLLRTHTHFWHGARCRRRRRERIYPYVFKILTSNKELYAPMVHPDDLI